MVNDVVDGSQKIGGHSFTVEWLLKTLRETAVQFQKKHVNRAVKEVTASDISKGKGFASEIFKCVITFVDSKNSSDVYSTMLKIPGSKSFQDAVLESGGKKFWEENDTLARVHASECEFYAEVAFLLPQVPIPKVHKTLKADYKEGKEGCILMEDLSTKGKTQFYFENVNLAKVKAVIRELAKMHKDILSVDPKLWHGKFLSNQLIHAKNGEKCRFLLEPVLARCKHKKELRPLIEKYQKFRESEEFYAYVFQESWKEAKMPPVLAHGDLQFGNIMYALDPHGDMQNEVAAIIDWQTYHEGSPMADLARFLAMSADGIVRRQAEEIAVDYYLDCLKKEFGGDQSKIPYTKEQLEKAYKLAFLTQILCLPAVPLFFLSAIEEKNNESVNDAFFDAGVLKALHGMQDADRLLQGEMNEYFEKYGI